MNRTLQTSFALKNAYRVNGILYSLKQIPLVKKILPEALYSVRGLKIFANVLSVIWELITVFLGKLLYLLFMITLMANMFKQLPKGAVFLHMLLLLTIAGAYMNTALFNPTKDKYYAISLMRMNAKEFTLVNYAYSMIKVIVGFLPFTILFGRGAGIPLWFCLLLPFCIAGMKLTVAAYSLWDYEKNNRVHNENVLNKYMWLWTAILLALAYGLPVLGVVLPEMISMVLLLLFIPVGMVCIHKIITFESYREVNQQLFGQMLNQMDMASQATKVAGANAITADLSIGSKRKGFEYLNELFIKRHQKILWKATKKISFVCVAIVAVLLIVLYLEPESHQKINELMLTWLPYMVFIMYAINRGTGFTRALFTNCDHSLLTYSFYKQPKYVLRLFRIRLREIIKINAVPAAILGGGMALLLYASGGTDKPLNYLILVVSMLCISIFFSVHYLTIYYLLQPYNMGTEMKSATYQVVMAITYFVCFSLMKIRMSTLVFGLMTIIFCVMYCIVACILVYRLAPKTFRIRV